MRKILLAALITVFSFGGLSMNAAQAGGSKVLYHVNQGNEQATDALRNINNHLSADPNAKIVVVTHSKGIDFLLDGATDEKGNPYAGTVSKLAAKGVEFRVCQITLERRNISAKKLVPEAKLVPSGVAEVTKLQQQEGYAYLKP